MRLGEKITDAGKKLAKKINDNSFGLIVAVVFMILLSAAVAGITLSIMREVKLSQKHKDHFLDYMPDVPRVCPGDYRCGGISRAQTKMEHRLYADLREGSKYALPETMTSDAYDVIATESEPTSCMIKRASVGTEAPMPEGQYTPWDEIESGFLSRHNKKIQNSITA